MIIISIIVTDKDGLWCFLAVKYLREVTPYFRKSSSSALNDVGWTDDAKPLTSSLSERAIPLRLCYVCRGDGAAQSTIMDGSGSGSSPSSPALQLTTLELHSPDRRSTCLIRCADEDSAMQWLTAICNVVASLTTRAVADMNAQLSSVTSNGTSSPTNNNMVPVSLGGDVKHLGWLSEQVRFARTVCSSETEIGFISANISKHSWK